MCGRRHVGLELLGAEDRLTAVYPDAGHDFPSDVREAAYTFMDEAMKGEA